MTEFEIVSRILKDKPDVYIKQYDTPLGICYYIELHCYADQVSLEFDENGKFIGVGE